MQTHQLIVRWTEAHNAGHEQEKYRTQHVRLQATMASARADQRSAAQQQVEPDQHDSNKSRSLVTNGLVYSQVLAEVETGCAKARLSMMGTSGTAGQHGVCPRTSRCEVACQRPKCRSSSASLKRSV